MRLYETEVRATGRGAPERPTPIDPVAVMLPMRDGVRLATDIYLSPNQPRLPVVLHRTPYGRRSTSASEASQQDPVPLSPGELARLFADRGYVLVVQDCRGRHDSEGEFVKYISDREDGYDVCEWLVAQPWRDGRTSTIGLSYDAHLQASAGCLDPPGLVAQVLDCGGLWNTWKTGTRHYGVFELKQATWAMRNAITSPEAASDPVMRSALEAEDLGAWLKRLPWRRGHSPLRHHPAYENALFEQWEHGPLSDHWRMLGIWTEGWHASYSKASIIHMSGWYDPYVLNVTENYLGLKAAGRGPQRLILGAFTHGRRSQTWAGDVEFGPSAPLDSWAGDWNQLRLNFFDTVTRGTVSRLAPVNLFLMGGGSGCRTPEGRLDHGGRWVEAADWPLPGTCFTTFYLRETGALTQTPPSPDETALSFDFDPANPVPTIGGNLASLQPFAEPGGFDQAEIPTTFGSVPPHLPLASRADVLVFQTEPLDEKVDIAGPISVVLHVSTDGPDTDFTAKLVAQDLDLTAATSTGGTQAAATSEGGGWSTEVIDASVLALVEGSVELSVASLDTGGVRLGAGGGVGMGAGGIPR